MSTLEVDTNISRNERSNSNRAAPSSPSKLTNEQLYDAMKHPPGCLCHPCGLLRDKLEKKFGKPKQLIHHPPMNYQQRNLVNYPRPMHMYPHPFAAYPPNQMYEADPYPDGLDSDINYGQQREVGVEEFKSASLPESMCLCSS